MKKTMCYIDILSTTKYYEIKYFSAFLEIWSNEEDAYFSSRNIDLHSTYTRYTVY